MNAFHICGGILAIWAVLVAALGIMRDGFPGNRATERLVEAVTAVLVVLAVASAIYTASTEKEEGGGGEHEAAAAVHA